MKPAANKRKVVLEINEFQDIEFQDLWGPQPYVDGETLESILQKAKVPDYKKYNYFLFDEERSFNT